MSAPGSTSVTAEVLTTAPRLREIGDRWRELAVAHGSPFTTPEWYEAAIAATPGAHPAVVVVRSGEDPVGVLPLVRVSRRGLRTLRFPGDRLGDAYAFLLDRDAPARHCWAAAGRAIAALRWDALLLFGADGESPWIEHLAQSARCTVHDRGDLTRPGIDAPPDGWDGLLAGMKRGNRKETRRLMRRIDELPDAAVGTSDGPDEVADAMDALFHLHDLRWGSGSSIPPGPMRTVLTAFSATAAKRGWLRLWTISVGGTPVAAELAWRLGSRQTHYQGGFDPEYAKLGVGIGVFAHAMREGLETGVSRIDLGQGESSYKMRYATDVSVSRRVVLTRKGRPAGGVARVTLAARGLVKRWTDAEGGLVDRLRTRLAALRR